VYNTDRRAAEGLDALEDLVPALRIDADRGLVEDQQLRLVQQADRDVGPALHSARVVVDPVAGALGEPDHVQHGFDPLREPAPVEVLEAPEELEVLCRGEIGVQRDVLRHESDQLLRRPGSGRERPARDCDRPLVGLQDAGHHRDRGGLARPVRTEESVDLAAGDLEAHIVDRYAVAEAPDQMLAPKQRFRHEYPACTPRCTSGCLGQRCRGVNLLTPRRAR
jgi:hypothetical protein